MITHTAGYGAPILLASGGQSGDRPTPTPKLEDTEDRLTQAQLLSPGSLLLSPYRRHATPTLSLKLLPPTRGLRARKVTLSSLFPSERDSLEKPLPPAFPHTTQHNSGLDHSSPRPNSPPFPVPAGPLQAAPRTAAALPEAQSQELMGPPTTERTPRRTTSACPSVPLSICLSAYLLWCLCLCLLLHL